MVERREGEDEITVALNKQIRVLQALAKTESVVVKGIREFKDRYASPLLAKRIRILNDNTQVRFVVSLGFLEVIAVNRMYETGDGRTVTVPKFIIDFEIITGEDRKILATETVRNIRNKYAQLQTEIEEAKNALPLVARANKEWEEIRSKVKEYREKYPSCILRNDLY